MTAPFVTELRTQGDVLVLGNGTDVLHLRAQAAELWDTLRVDAASTTSVAEIKNAALARFYPDGASPAEFVVKVRGFEILDENESISRVGIRDGSTLLITQRRRRPVR